MGDVVKLHSEVGLAVASLERGRALALRGRPAAAVKGVAHSDFLVQMDAIAVVSA